MSRSEVRIGPLPKAAQRSYAGFVAVTKPLDLDRAQRRFRQALGVGSVPKARPIDRVHGLDSNPENLASTQAQAKQWIEKIGLPTTWTDPLPSVESDVPRYPFVMTALDVPSGSVCAIYGQGQLAFSGECFAVDPACADRFLMTAILTANVRCTIGEIGEPWMPCSLFKEWKRWDLEPMTPANRISFSVKNIGDDVRTFRAVLFGKVRPYEDVKYDQITGKFSVRK